MQTEHVSTPFGRRSMTFGMLASQIKACEIAPAKSVDKWKIYRALCEAKPLLGVTDRALALLNALLSFYPKNEISEENGLVVFPSNAQLSLRAHGMAEQTIRRHLAVLVETGLLIRRDSPNGKRYARRGRQGEVNEAFGFSVAPLLSRAEEIEELAAVVAAERLELKRLRERISLCRRDIAKLVETAFDGKLDGDWQGIHNRFRGLVDSVPRTPDASDLAALSEDLVNLREEIVNRLEMLVKSKNNSGNACQNERHIQNSNPDSKTESELFYEIKESEITINEAEPADRRPPDIRFRPVAERDRLTSFPLGLVLQACPEVLAYGPGGRVDNWRDMMSAAVVVRSTLGVSPSAYEHACAVMGPENAATVMACILERGGHISSAGGYLRDLTRRTEKGEFAIGPMLMALARTNGNARAKSG